MLPTFPPTPRTGYPQLFIEKNTNLYNIRLLLNNNQHSLQNIFEEKNLKQPLEYLGQHIFEYCNFIKKSYSLHHDLWANLNTKTQNETLIGIISHPIGEKASKTIKKEHQLAGMQKDYFEKNVGNVSRINMSTGQTMRSKHRPVAHLKKLQKLTCQTA